MMSFMASQGRFFMRRIVTPLALCLTLFLAGCRSNTQDNNVVSERYIHKYGFVVSKNEFEERKYPGQVITSLKQVLQLLQPTKTDYSTDLAPTHFLIAKPLSRTI